MRCVFWKATYVSIAFNFSSGPSSTNMFWKRNYVLWFGEPSVPSVQDFLKHRYVHSAAWLRFNAHYLYFHKPFLEDVRMSCEMKTYTTHWLSKVSRTCLAVAPGEKWKETPARKMFTRNGALFRILDRSSFRIGLTPSIGVSTKECKRWNIQEVDDSRRCGEFSEIIYWNIEYP